MLQESQVNCYLDSAVVEVAQRGLLRPRKKAKPEVIAPKSESEAVRSRPATTDGKKGKNGKRVLKTGTSKKFFVVQKLCAVCLMMRSLHLAHVFVKSNPTMNGLKPYMSPLELISKNSLLSWMPHPKLNQNSVTFVSMVGSSCVTMCAHAPARCTKRKAPLDQEKARRIRPSHML